jgi:FkbM family methyltransferase
MLLSCRKLRSEKELRRVHPWYSCPNFRDFPPVARAWVSWCARGWKRRGGGSFGANLLFRLMRSYYRLHPYDGDNYVTISSSFDGFPFVVDLLDFEIYHHTVPLLSHRRPELELFKGLLAPNTTFIDIGANHGIFALTAAHRPGCSISVHAFEPQPRPREALQRSVREARLDNVVVHSLALGQHHGTSEFSIPDIGSGIGSLSKGLKSNAITRTVSVRPLDAVVTERHIDDIGLIKVDVEGWEYQVFLGGKQTLTSRQPLIWFEANPSALQPTGHSTDDLFALLRSYGYVSFFDIAELAEGTKREIFGADCLKDVLAVPEAKRESLTMPFH